MRRFPLVSLCLILAACGPAENDAGPGNVTVNEAKALDEAAAMLDARRAPVAAPTGAPSPAATPAG